MSIGELGKRNVVSLHCDSERVSHRFAQILSLQATVLYTSSLTVKKVSTNHTTTMLFFICHTHIPGRIFLFLINCEYFCRRFTSGILNYKQDESTNINKREGKKKGCFISRFPYFTAYHGRIWISGTDHLERAYHITTVAEEG